MPPKVTVITPAYNAERYLEKTVASLLAQSFQDWELVIVDDGSTDSTPRILESFTDKRIKTIHQKNGGEARARNTGLENAAGEYIAFLDADDLYLPNALEDLSAFLDSHPEYSVVYSDGHICDEEDRPLMRLNEIRSGIQTGNVLENIVISSSIVTVPVCTMTRSSVVREHEIRFDPNLVIGPDWDFWIQIAVHGKFGYLDKVTCMYRVHNSNITKRVDMEKRKRDIAFGRMKVMNSDWFDSLSLFTRETFFSGLLMQTLSGNPVVQNDVLASKPFSRLPADMRARLWRTVGVNVWQCQRNNDAARPYFYESQKLNPDDRKTRLLVQGLSWAPWLTLQSTIWWQRTQHLKIKLTSARYSQSKRLQRLFGF